MAGITGLGPSLQHEQWLALVQALMLTWSGTNIDLSNCITFLGMACTYHILQTPAGLLVLYRRARTHQRRTGFAARVAQFRPVTGSGDSNSSSQDIDVEQQGFPAHDAAGHLVFDSPAEQLSQVVQQEAHRLRLEQVYNVAGVVSADRHAALNSHSTDDHSRALGSRDLSSPVEDEALPLLAESAAHPVSSQPQQQLQQQQYQDQEPAAAAAAGPALIGGIPRSILVLSMVSMALTSASCVFNTLLPIYMVTELKMTMRTMGMFEGDHAKEDFAIAESTASMLMNVWSSLIVGFHLVS